MRIVVYFLIFSLLMLDGFFQPADAQNSGLFPNSWIAPTIQNVNPNVTRCLPEIGIGDRKSAWENSLDRLVGWSKSAGNGIFDQAQIACLPGIFDQLEKDVYRAYEESCSFEKRVSYVTGFDFRVSVDREFKTCEPVIAWYKRISSKAYTLLNHYDALIKKYPELFKIQNQSIEAFVTKNIEVSDPAFVTEVLKIWKAADFSDWMRAVMAQYEALFFAHKMSAFNRAPFAQMFAWNAHRHRNLPLDQASGMLAEIFSTMQGLKIPWEKNGHTLKQEVYEKLDARFRRHLSEETYLPDVKGLLQEVLYDDLHNQFAKIWELQWSLNLDSTDQPLGIHPNVTASYKVSNKAQLQTLLCGTCTQTVQDNDGIKYNVGTLVKQGLDAKVQGATLSTHDQMDELHDERRAESKSEYDYLAEGLNHVCEDIFATVENNLNYTDYKTPQDYVSQAATGLTESQKLMRQRQHEEYAKGATVSSSNIRKLLGDSLLSRYQKSWTELSNAYVGGLLLADPEFRKEVGYASQNDNLQTCIKTGKGLAPISADQIKTSQYRSLIIKSKLFYQTMNQHAKLVNHQPVDLHKLLVHELIRGHLPLAIQYLWDHPSERVAWVILRAINTQTTEDTAFGFLTRDLTIYGSEILKILPIAMVAKGAYVPARTFYQAVGGIGLLQGIQIATDHQYAKHDLEKIQQALANAQGPWAQFLLTQARNHEKTVQATWRRVAQNMIQTGAGLAYIKLVSRNYGTDRSPTKSEWSKEFSKGTYWTKKNGFKTGGRTEVTPSQPGIQIKRPDPNGSGNGNDWSGGGGNTSTLTPPKTSPTSTYINSWTANKVEPKNFTHTPLPADLINPQGIFNFLTNLMTLNVSQLNLAPVPYAAPNSYIDHKTNIWFGDPISEQDLKRIEEGKQNSTQNEDVFTKIMHGKITFDVIQEMERLRKICDQSPDNPDEGFQAQCAKIRSFFNVRGKFSAYVSETSSGFKSKPASENEKMLVKLEEIKKFLRKIESEITWGENFERDLEIFQQRVNKIKGQVQFFDNLTDDQKIIFQEFTLKYLYGDPRRLKTNLLDSLDPGLKTLAQLRMHAQTTISTEGGYAHLSDLTEIKKKIDSILNHFGFSFYHFEKNKSLTFQATNLEMFIYKYITLIREDVRINRSDLTNILQKDLAFFTAALIRNFPFISSEDSIDMVERMYNTFFFIPDSNSNLHTHPRHFDEINLPYWRLLARLNDAMKLVESGGDYTPALKQEIDHLSKHSKSPEMRSAATDLLEDNHIDVFSLEDYGDIQTVLNPENAKKLLYALGIKAFVNYENALAVVRGKLKYEEKNAAFLKTLSKLPGPIGFFTRAWYMSFYNIPISLNPMRSYEFTRDSFKLGLIQEFSGFDDPIGAVARKWLAETKIRYYENLGFLKNDSEETYLKEFLYGSSWISQREVNNLYKEIVFGKKSEMWASAVGSFHFKNPKIINFKEFERLATYIFQISPNDKINREKALFVLNRFFQLEYGFASSNASLLADRFVNMILLSSQPRQTTREHNILNSLIDRSKEKIGAVAVNAWIDGFNDEQKAIWKNVITEIVSSDPRKNPEKNIYNYENFDVIMDEITTINLQINILESKQNTTNNGSAEILKFIIEERVRKMANNLLADNHFVLANDHHFAFDDVGNIDLKKLKQEFFSLMYLIHTENALNRHDEGGISRRLTALAMYINKVYPRININRATELVRLLAQNYILGDRGSPPTDKNPNVTNAGEKPDENESKLLQKLEGIVFSADNLHRIQNQDGVPVAPYVRRLSLSMGDFFIKSAFDTSETLSKNIATREYAAYLIEKIFIPQYSQPSVLIETNNQKMFVRSAVKNDLKFKYYNDEITYENLSNEDLGEVVNSQVRKIGEGKWEKLKSNDILHYNIPEKIFLFDLLIHDLDRFTTKNIYIVDYAIQENIYSLQQLPIVLTPNPIQFRVIDASNAFEISLKNFVMSDAEKKADAKELNDFFRNLNPNFSGIDDIEPLEVIQNYFPDVKSIVSVQDFIHKILLSHPDFVGQLRAWGSDVIENKIGHYLTPEELKTLLDNRQILLDIADGVFHAGLIRGDTQSNQARDSVSGFSGIFLPIIDLTRNNVGPLNKSKDQPELPKRPNTGDAFSSLFVEEEFAGDIHLDSATFDFANQKKVLSVDDIIQNKVLFVFDESLIYEMNQILRQNSEKSAEIRKWIQDHLSPNQHFYEILAAQISQLLNNPNLDTVETQGQHIAIDWMARYAQQNDSIQNSAQMWMDNHKQLQNQMKAWLFEALQQYQLKKSRERFTYPGSDNLKRKVEITISNSYVIISEFNSNGDKRPFFSFDYNVTSGNRVRLIPAADLITKYNDRYFHESLFTGKDLMDFMFYFIEQFNGYEIESISAQWKYNDDPILSQNYYQFVKNLSLTPPQTLEQAASNTWTGQIYGSHGFYVSTGSFSVGNGIIGRPWAWVKCEFINGKSRPQKITDSNNFFNNNFFRHFFSGIFMPIVTLAPNLGNITLEDSIAYLNSPTIGEISEPSIDKLSFNQISQFESVKNRDPQKVVKKWTDPSGMTFYFIYEPPNPIRNFLANIISLNFNSTEAEKEQGMHVIGQKLGINYLKTKLLDFNGVRVFVAEEVKNDLKINYKDFKGQIHHNVNMETAYTLMTRDLSFSSKFSNAEKYKILERGGFRFNIKDKNILLDLLTGTSDRGLRHNIFVLNYRSISKIFNLDSLPIDIQSEDNIFQFYDAGQAFVWDLETRLSAPYNFQKDLQEYFFDDINISNPVLYLKSMLAKPENQDFVRSLQNWSENEIHEDLSFLDIDQRNVFLRNRTVMLKYANEIMKQ